MEIAEAIEVVIARTNHERFRELCDPSHPDYQPLMVQRVIALAEGRDPATAIDDRPTTPSEAPQYYSPSQPAAAPILSGLPLAGDLIATATATFGADRLAKWLTEKLGIECGCPERRARWNALDAKLRRHLGLTVPRASPVEPPNKAG
jgi:hypothetical protein